jgi:predicted HTH domain antitoxin
MLPLMQAITLTLPADSLIGVRIPRRDLEMELRRRLAAALFTDGILSGVSACRMAGMGKAEFQHMLGERGVNQPLAAHDLEQDLENLAAWKAS